MALLNPFKLERLQIKAYSDRKRSSLVGTVKVMFNPESYQQRYAITYGKSQGINSSGKEVNYSYSTPSELNLTLVIDDSGVDQLFTLFPADSVPDRVKEFLDLTFHMNGDIHEPNYLTVCWGDLTYSCRLSSVDVSYTYFSRDGKPTRAELYANFIADDDVDKRMAQENKSSPDLTHMRLVKNGDTLPLLSKEIYGTSEHYLKLAQYNKLDNFRNLTPGNKIYFPPLEEIS